MDVELEVGKVVKISTLDGSYVGVVHVCNRQNITLRNAISIGTEEKVRRRFNFAISEIIDCAYLDEGNIFKDCDYKTLLTSRLLLGSCIKGSVDHLDRRAVNVDGLAAGKILRPDDAASPCAAGVDQQFVPAAATADIAVVTNVADGRVVETDRQSVRIASSPLDDKLSDNESDIVVEPSLVVISAIDSTFTAALEDIRRCPVVGLSVEGVDIGRDGHLALLLMATADQTYIFDVMVLRNAVFTSGLGDILESKNTQKVAYNVRNMSDLLLHRFSVVLNNVFDCQVADVVLFRRRNSGRIPRYPGSLALSVRKNLRLPITVIFFQRVRLHVNHSDEVFWCQRPLTHKQLLAASKNVAYLRRLRAVQIEKLFSCLGFISATNAYLNSYRQLADDCCPQEMGCDDVPEALQRCLIRHDRVFENCGSVFVENSGMLTRDPFIQLAHDSITHGRLPAT